MIIAVCFSFFLYVCKHLKIIYIFREKQEKRFFTESWGIGKKINYDLALYSQCKLLRQYLKIFGQAFAKACGSRAVPLSPIAMGEISLCFKKRRKVLGNPRRGFPKCNAQQTDWLQGVNHGDGLKWLTI